MKKEIELIEKLNQVKKYKLNPIKDLSIFLRLYFKNIRLFKFQLFLNPAISVFVVFISLTSLGVYSYNSNSIVYGDALYPIKTSIENVIVLTKTNQEDKVNYYAKLIDRRLAELNYLENKNFVKIISSISFINTAYAEDASISKNYSSSIAKTISEIILLNEKADNEILKIRDENIKKKVNKLIEEKKDKQIKVFDNIKIKNNLLKNNNKVDKKVLDEIDDVINKKVKKLIEEKNNKINQKNIDLQKDEKEKINIDKDKIKNSTKNLELNKKEEYINIEDNKKDNENKIEGSIKNEKQKNSVNSEDKIENNLMEKSKNDILDIRDSSKYNKNKENKPKNK